MNVNLKRVLASALLCASFVAGSAMAGQTTASSTADTRIVPVLVQVDSHGTITRADPAAKLKPGLQRLLHQTLVQMINKPAHDKNGKPIASQFIINLSMHATPVGNGQYKANFAYVSMQKVGIGKWHWAYNRMHQEPVLVNSSGASIAARVQQTQRLQARQARTAEAAARYNAQHQSHSGNGNNGHSH